MTKTLYRKSGYAIPKIGVRYTENRGTLYRKSGYGTFENSNENTVYF